MSASMLSFSGWTQSPESLRVVAPDALAIDYATAKTIDEVANTLPMREVDIVVGWSLGALIARQLMQRGALKAGRFISIAAPYQFVRDAALHEAMPQDTFAQFYANYRDDTQRTVGRFSALVAKGDANARQVLAAIQHHPLVGDASLWLPWMDVLKSYSARHHAYDALPPTLVIHGEQDAIIHPKQAELLAEHLPDAQLYLLSDAGHAPHLHDAQAVRQRIQEFVA